MYHNSFSLNQIFVCDNLKMFCQVFIVTYMFPLKQEQGSTMYEFKKNTFSINFCFVYGKDGKLSKNILLKDMSDFFLFYS